LLGYDRFLLAKFKGCISNFRFMVTFRSFWLPFELLFFLSKKVTKKGHRRRLRPGGGGFPDVAFALL
jgi:hypothetical protein